MNSLFMKTPFTGLKIVCSDEALLEIDFVNRAHETKRKPSRLMARVQQQIEQYCQSKRQQFDVPLQPQGTEFQQKVWQAMLEIPYGQVRTYGDIARQLKSSPRAVGNACRANPIPLIIPCHRVLAASGIGGYAGATEGGRLEIKRQLLRHEGVEI